VTRLSRLAGRHAGERCVLVANGPSLNRMDLSGLRRELTIGLNKIFLGLDRFGFYPRYYVAVNETVLRQSADRIRALNCVKFLAARAAEAGLAEDGLTYLVRSTGDVPRFSRDLDQGLHEGWTVTYAALQVAWHLGFSEVVLIGLDHRYAFEGQPNESRVLAGPDSNHFDPGYFGHGQRWDNPDLARSEESFRIARQVFEGDGRRILDATPDGACTVFPKVRWPDLLPTR
jgi:Protein of unknown function DUF115